MQREPRDGGADLDAVFAAGQSGNFPAPYLTIDELDRLNDRCLKADRIICNLEAFEIVGEFDHARIDLSLYSDEPVQKIKPWAERLTAFHARVRETVEDARREPNRVMFTVWLDWER
ncbi:MAG: hypothetical protein IR159_08040 [Brevundimonas sp.]|nr:hypothetical protein [Brevundimonas sp.]